VLVCPNCRNENLEDAQFCHACGRGLEPVSMGMRSQVQREDATDMDLPAPKPRRVLPLVLILVAFGAFAVAGSLWYAARPNPCEGKFSSVLFAYCAEIPEGWRGGSQLAAEEPEDRFTPSEDDAVTLVRVEETVDPATQTQQYAQQFRISQEVGGLDPGRVEPVPLDGEEALGWEYSTSSSDGETLRIREVILVRQDGAWRITLAATETAYPEARQGFEELLATWSWK
jgi:hypothetical protein